jgi:putative restriction endonuclease
MDPSDASAVRPSTSDLGGLGDVAGDTKQFVSATGRTFGEIAGVPPGTVFPNRRALADAGVHRPIQAGISGSANEGADSIVVSGGYEDDEDYGDVIVYTGHGGNDPSSRRQVADQLLERGNLAVARSCEQGLPFG